MRRNLKRILAGTLAALIAFPNVSGLILPTYAATYRNGAQSGPSSSYKGGKYYKNYQKVPITGDNVTDLLAIALSQLGYQEGNSNGSFSGESSGSSNYVEFSYNMGDLGLGYGGSDYPWCACFVSWCLYQSHCTDQGTYSALARSHKGDINYIWKEISCSQWVTQLNNFGYFKKSKNRGGSYTPKTGDLVFFTNKGTSADHIGICVYTDGTKIYTVEGNTSDAAGLEDNGGGVYFKSYNLTSTYLYGYGTLPYKENTSVADIDYSGTNPTPGLYIAANSNKYVYTTKTATDYSYLLPRFSIFEVDEICDNGRLGGTFTINGETVKGYVMNNTDRVIQLSSTNTTADEREQLKTLIGKAESARHYQYSESAITELRTAYEAAVKSYSNTSEKEATLQKRINALEQALANTGSNEIAFNNKGIYVNGINKKITAGDCVVFTNKHGGDGLISVSNANIAYTVNVVVKWNAELGMNVVKSVNVAEGINTPSIQLESDEYLIAAHDWEYVDESQGKVEYSGTNFNLLSNLKVGTGVIASGINLEDPSGVAPCSFIKFVPAEAVRMNGRNEIVEPGDFTLFTPEFNSGDLTATNANIHKTLNVIAKWDNQKEGWFVTDKYVGTGAADEKITIADGTVVLAGLVKEGDGISQVSYKQLNAAKVGDKIIFSGISPNAGSKVSVAANISFETTASEEPPTEEESSGKEETTTKAEETTKKQEETSSKVEETTSKEEETTKKQEETSSKVEETTSKEEETTKKQEETSSKVEETTSKKEETTKKQEETSNKEEETTEQPEESSSSEEESSNKEEETTQKQEETSSQEEESTSEEENTEESTEEVELVSAKKPVILKRPESAIYFCNEKAMELKAVAKSEDGGELSYQWYRNTKKSTKGAVEIEGATEMAYTPSTNKAGSCYYYCIVTNTNAGVTGTQTAKINSGYAKVQVKKLANKITGVNTNWKKSVDADVFKLTPTAKGTITYKSSNESVAIVSSTGTVAVKKIGTAYITITAGNELYQTVTKRVKVQVVPETVNMNYIASGAKKALSVKWDKMSDVSGFKIQYSTTKDFKNVKTSYVGSLRHSKTRSDLNAGTKYYVRVCAYKKIGKTSYYGEYSDVKSFTVKK